jgi:hypothetical protein
VCPRVQVCIASLNKIKLSLRVFPLFVQFSLKASPKVNIIKLWIHRCAGSIWTRPDQRCKFPIERKFSSIKIFSPSQAYHWQTEDVENRGLYNTTSSLPRTKLVHFFYSFNFHLSSLLRNFLPKKKQTMRITSKKELWIRPASLFRFHGTFIVLVL